MTVTMLCDSIEYPTYRVGSKIDQDLLRKAAEVYCQVWQEAPWFEMEWDLEEVIRDICAMVDRDEGVLILAVEGDQIAGMTSGWVLQRDKLVEMTENGIWVDSLVGKIFYVAEVLTNPSRRNRGLATELSRQLIENAVEFGCSTITLRTDVEAFPARRVYEKLGFVESSIVDKNHPRRTYWVFKV